MGNPAERFTAVQFHTAPIRAFSDSTSEDEETRAADNFGTKLDKVYEYGPTREVLVEVFSFKGVRVTYIPTLRRIAWRWHVRDLAFVWAKDRAAYQRAVGWGRR